MKGEILILIGGIGIFFIVVPGVFIYWNKRLLREIKERENALRMLGTNMDITQRKLYESEREITLHLLRHLQKDTDLYSLSKDIAALLKNWSGSDAVGIRLQQGDDYPYFEAIGFPREFLETENRLCAVDEKGNLILDDKGCPVLECMCGNVIRRRFDPSLPFYTDNGSFWTNSVTDLLTDPRAKDLSTCIRSNFHSREYESIALIPLHIGNRSIGLLQFNYSKPDCFDAEKIAVMERLASNLAIGLSQRTTALALLESERRYRAVFDKAAYSIYLVDPDTGAFFDYNVKAYETLGYTREEFKNLTLADIETVESPEEITAHMEKILRHKSDMFESRQKTKDGEIRDVLINCSLVTFGEKTYILSVTSDVTEQKKMEKEREHLLSAIEQIEEIIIITDIEGMIFYTNPAFMKITGHSHKEVSGKDIRKYVGLSHQGSSTAMTLSQTILDGTQWHEEVMNKYNDGTPCILEWTVSPVNDNQGNILNFVWIARDVTREQELEKKVAHAQRMESIGNLAGGIAHDFNNILAPIVGMSEMLLEDLPHGSIEYENAGEILKAGIRGSDLVKQILAFSRQSEPRKIPVRVQSVLKEVIRLCRSTIPSNIGINHEIQSDCGLVMADATQLHQVAMNLITNAYHAVEASNGEIFISLKEIEEVPYDLSENILEPGKYAKLTVTDTGCGMESHVMDKIFEPYFTTKKQGKGTGLGLSVVYGIINDHKGHIDVGSDPGRGSRFNVFLPLIRKSSDTIFSPKPEAYPSGNEKVLLVDDEEPIVRLLQQALERLGYTITARMSSLDALEAFKAKPDAYDLVITDMSMPNMTGIQLAGELLKVRAGIPVIICTGFSERITPETAMQVGIKGVLMKPIAKLDLTRMVRQILDEAQVTGDIGLAI